LFDIITIGGATQDIFAESDNAKIINIETISNKKSYLCFDYGEKMEMDQLAYDFGGGASNAAANFANLGLKTGIIIKIGNDLTAEAIKQRLKERKIDSSMVIQSKSENTGFSIILTSYEGDRTVLAHRGANSTISHEDIDWDSLKKAKWIYIASLSGQSNSILQKLANFAESNGINTAFNPGSTQIKRGIKDLQKILETAEILIMNRSEASAVTGIENYPPELPSIDDENIRKLLFELKNTGAKLVVITEGKKGAYAFEGKTLYYCPVFPSKVISTLGAGDAFSSTFVATIINYDWDIDKALKFASINAAKVVESFGAQNGFKTFEEIEKIIQLNPNYNITKSLFKL